MPNPATYKLVVDTTPLVSKIVIPISSSPASYKLIDVAGVMSGGSELVVIKGQDGVSSISADPDNRAVLGTDNGVFVPEYIGDPVAYYILAKS